MNRRQFLSVSGAASVAMVAPMAGTAANSSAREYYELRQFILDTPEQKQMLDSFLKGAFIPAANRMGLKPVGVFYPEQGISPLYLLLRHASLESVATWMGELARDQEFLGAGAEFIDAPASAPAYKRIESTLMEAFTGMPRLEVPASNPGRVFQLRIYESPSVKTGLKKIEMFNDAGEIRIFREVGLNPVFFGRTLVGTRMPNLTYMLAFRSKDEQQAAWKKFGAHPEWKKLSGMPEYSDKTILSGITNLVLQAAEYSQI